MKEIALTGGAVAIVDDDMFDHLSKWGWYLHSAGYAVRGEHVGGKYRSVLMHRVVLGDKPGLCVDHINGNRLDNRRANLRFASVSENVTNQRRSYRNTSGYRGVNWSKPNAKWAAYIGHEGRTVYLGYFEDVTEAARAYDAAARRLKGQFAVLNFPND